MAQLMRNVREHIGQRPVSLDEVKLDEGAVRPVIRVETGDGDIAIDLVDLLEWMLWFRRDIYASAYEWMTTTASTMMRTNPLYDKPADVEVFKIGDEPFRPDTDEMRAIQADREARRRGFNRLGYQDGYGEMQPVIADYHRLEDEAAAILSQRPHLLAQLPLQTKP